MIKLRLPFLPLQEGYSVQFGDGTQRIALDGGPARYRAGVQGNPNTVTALWRLRDDKYSLFMGFYRACKAQGGGPFEVDLKIDGYEERRYDAYFLPGSVRLVSKAGRFFTVAATLEVDALPEFDGGDLDYWASLIMLLAIYGSIPAAREILNLLAKLVNEDLPHA